MMKCSWIYQQLYVKSHPVFFFFFVKIITAVWLKTSVYIGLITEVILCTENCGLHKHIYESNVTGSFPNVCFANNSKRVSYKCLLFGLCPYHACFVGWLCSGFLNMLECSLKVHHSTVPEGQSRSKPEGVELGLPTVPWKTESSRI